MTVFSTHDMDPSSTTNDLFPSTLPAGAGLVSHRDAKSTAAAPTFVHVELPDPEDWSGAFGDDAGRRLGDLHDRLTRNVMKEYGGQRTGGSDAYRLIFDLPECAVAFALAYHKALDRMRLEVPARVGIYLDEALRSTKTAASCLDLAQRLSSMARERQIMATGEVVRQIRQSWRESRRPEACEVYFTSYGRWETPGVARPIEIFDVSSR